MENLYQTTILEHGHRPHNFGKPQTVSISREGFNPLCGDKISLYSSTNTSNLCLMFESVSCVICKASASLMTLTINESSIDDGLYILDEVMNGIKNGNIDLDVFTDDMSCLNQIVNYPSRINCALLPWKTAKTLIKDLKHG
tara:strand:+ start:174 stop:596 length:423 start_codon:yes stop_codon:yes gene_type:complete